MTCKDCVNYDFCEKLIKCRWEIDFLSQQSGVENHCVHFKDKSLFVEIPCRPGDTVYVLSNDSLTGIEESVCKKIRLKLLQDGVIAVAVVPCVYDDWGGACREFTAEEFGKRIFLKYKEAEQKLKENRN